VKDILNVDGSPSIASLKEPADQRLLVKLRNLYYSCMDESTLDQLGEGPLKDFVSQVKRLYRGESTGIADSYGGDKEQDGLTAALAFLHSRGDKHLREPASSCPLTAYTGIPALFEFGVEGDVAFDPNFMILWFQQPALGLPSKVCTYPPI
jgi:endothelin-converting enzyme